jgi:hypothetical protein
MLQCGLYLSFMVTVVVNGPFRLNFLLTHFQPNICNTGTFPFPSEFSKICAPKFCNPGTFCPKFVIQLLVQRVLTVLPGIHDHE